MSYLFDPVRFDNKPMLWGYKTRSEKDFAGFYHLHQCSEILYVHEGQGSIVVNQKTYEIRRGMLFFFQPYQLHRVYANVSSECPYVRTVLHFDPVFIADNLRAFPGRSHFFNQLWKGQNPEQGYDLLRETAYTERIFEMFENTKPLGKGESDEEITMLFLHLVNSIAAVKQDMDSKSVEGITRPFHYSETIMQWIEEHYMQDINLDDLAGALHLSKFYVSRVFREETGSNITDYLTARRIKQACRLLQTTTLPIERIGIAVGFPNVSYFIRLFKHIIGTTPLRYKKAVDFL